MKNYKALKFVSALLFVFLALSGFASETNTIYKTNFQQLIGKSLYDNEMREFLSRFRHEPKYESKDNGSYDYSFKGEGIRLTFAVNHILRMVTFHNQDADGFTQYAGQLPYGLTFSMTKGEVENILGTPTRGFSIPVNDKEREYYVYYYTKFLGISYVTNPNSSEEKGMIIKHISVN